MKKNFVCLFAMLLPAFLLQAQVRLPGAWKFHTGDNPQWAQPGFSDQDWKPIEVGHLWEEEGYPDYDGYGWYRTHVVIPSSLKTNSYLKGPLKIELGKIDDGDEVYLNGHLIGQNAGRTKDITKGRYNIDRTYYVDLKSPLIHWDKDNVIAVRVYDHGGGGGMYEGKYLLGVSDITDFIKVDDNTNAFTFPAAGRLKKTILLQSTDPKYSFTGKLTLRITNPATKETVWQQSVPVTTFTATKPFRYTYSFHLPAQQSYEATYTFTESRSGKQVTVAEGVPYILTPPPSPLPRIHGATIVGVRPGHPLLFKVPVTGSLPIRYGATGLPAGFVLSNDGVITGQSHQPGSYTVHLTASNKLGKNARDLTIVVGDQVSLTPALGWNSWNCWGLSVSDAKVRAAADAMKRSGLLNHGWTYINIDDGWERPARTASGEVVANEKFPDMKKMCDYVHSLGLKVGIYSSPGPKTCGGYLGSYQHEEQDAATYAKWGIDYLKYDWCSYGEIYPKPTLEEMQKPYRVMRAALDKTDRDIVFSFCQYGMGQVWKWGGETGGNSWRTTGDIRDTWSSMSGIGFHQDKCAPYTRPGNWNDPDMLVVGKVGWGPSLHYTRLTPDEQYTHISLWCLLSAPLLIGCDMSQMDDFTLNLLSNDEVLAIDQDAAGKPAQKALVDGDIQVWTKPLQDGSLAVGLFNLGPSPAGFSLPFTSLGLSGKQGLRDCWRQKDLGAFENSFEAKGIPSHGVLLLKISRQN